MAKGRKKRAELTEYEKAVADYRKTSARHVLVLEADLTEDEKRRIFYDADLVRQCGNTLVGIMKRNYEQLARTKRYRRLKELYGTLSETVKKMESLESPTRDQKTLLKQKHFELKSCAASMSEMQEFYHVTWEFCRKQMESIKESYGVPSVFALTRAEDIWRSVEKILYSDGKQLHFRKRGDLPEIRAKQASRAIVIKSSDSGLVFKYRDLNIHCKIKPGDTWALAEQDAILAYLKNPDLCDAYAVSSMDKGMIDTFRPCYASLVCKEIRGKLRVYVHLTIEGNPIQKTKNGHARHQYGKGNVGTDIGTQTVAYTSTNKVGLENLAERGNTIEHSERMERRILRAMDRSRRATNPENYNPDGTIKKGKKVWIKSNRYRKLQKRHQELCWINAQNRKLALTPNGSTADSFKSNTAQKGGAICHNGTFFKMVGGSTIDTGNDVFLSTGKYITVPSALSSSFAARVTPEEYESGRVVVRNTYGVKGSTIKSKFTLTPSGGFYLLGGDMYTGANSADVVLAKGFTITYNANGGTGAPAAQSKGTGESVKISSTKPTRSGYTFKNWNTLIGGNGITYNPGDTYSENADLNLYAQWTSSGSSGGGSTATKYTLTYNPNGGSVYPTSKQLAAGEKYGTLPTPTRSGHTFNGWYTSATGGSKVSETTKMGSYNTTIYAHWAANAGTGGGETTTKYTLTYNANGGSVYPTSKQLSAGEKYGTLPTPTRSGYTFTGWYTSTYGSTKVSENTTMGSSNTTIYAHWTSSGSGGTTTKYTLTYNANGGSVYPTSKQLSAGEKYGTLPIPKREGYTFDGWYTSPYSYFATKVSADTVMGSFNVTIYAHWTENVKTYTVKYNGNGNTGGSTASSTHTVGVAKNLTANGFTRTGYAFAGWNTSANGNGTSYADKESVKDLSTTNGATVTLYAKWTPREYQLTMNPNGGAFADGNTNAKTLSPNLIYDGTNWHNVSSNTVSRTGYTFDGWYDKATGGEKVYNTDGTCISGTYWKNNTYKYTGNLTVYAHWTAKKYTVTYNSNGGSGSMATDTVTYGTAYRTKANQFTKTGYTFVGWNEKANGTGSDWTSWIGKDWTWTYTKNVTLYAQWRVNSYTLNITGDSGVEKITGNGSYSCGVTANVTYKIKTGYHITSTSGTTVDGNPDGSWTDKAGAEGAVNDSWEIKTCDRTIVVHTAPNTYTVKYNGNGNNGGSTANSTHTYDVAKNLTKNGFVKTGYIFVGWNTSANGSGTSYADKASVKNLSSTNGATITLYAQWTANQYQLTLNPNNGSFSDGTTVAKTLNPDLIYNGYNWCDISSQKVSRTGYTFDGWYDKASGGEKVYDVNGSCVTGTYWKNNIYQHTGNLTVYAHWAPKSVVVTFHRNVSSSDTVTAQQTFTYDKAGQKFTDKDWTKKGYTLLGWSDSKDAATATYPITYGVSNEWINGRYPKTDLYAVWKANTYTIKYNGNGNDGGSTASSTHTVDLAKNLTVNGFTKTGCTFIGWNTKADGTGTPYKDQQSVKNLAYENGAIVTLYAQWSANKYIVVFNANGGTGKMEDQEMIYDKATALRANTFTRVGYRFNGWNTRADGTGTTYADKATVKNLAEKTESRVILYAGWHSASPELEAKDATYYEGQEITKKDLLKNVTKAFDAEDGDVTGKVKIVKIEYAAGKLVDGKEQPGYVSEWKDGMPDGEKLDTWFMQLPKEKAPVTHKITYQVTDLSGKTTTKTSSILVKYNEFPVITGVDRYFTLADAKAGKITEDALLKDAIKSGKLKSDDKEEGVISNKITILDYKDTDFKNVNGNATVTVVFKVTDSMGPGGVGKETIYEIKVKIIDPESNYWRDDDESASRKKVRFITKKYYDKNKDLDYRDMSSEAIEASSDNGGLNVMSKWYQNADYKALLTGTFEKETGTEYKIDSEKAKKLKEKIETDGIGNSKRDNALTDIYNSLK